MKNYSNSPMWNKICEEHFKEFNINSFRNNGPNNKISLYNPQTHGIFFLKSIIWHFTKALSKREREILEKIPNRLKGDPVTINFNEKLEVDLDYLQCTMEINFLFDILGDIKSIIEIGAGYGRTAHSIISIFDNIERYYIVDLKPVIKLSKKFLEGVLSPDKFQKIVFVEAEEFQGISEKLDLCINIDSMQEMSKTAVVDYLSFIDESCYYFYSKNTIGKFSPELCGMAVGSSTNLALTNGILVEKLNIFSEPERFAAQKKFLTAFTPAKNWQCIKHSECLPWPHYYQALYNKKSL